MDLNTLAVIPARGGSKAIPRKNIRILGGKPLLAWTIEAALQAESVEHVVVSTDDLETARLAESWGAEVPFVRPRELADDDAPGIAVALHALKACPGFDWIVYAQPTSPFRSAADLDGAARLAQRFGATSVVSVAESKSNPHWAYYIDASHSLTPVVDQGNLTRRQDLPVTFTINGAIYLARRDWLVASRTFVTEETLGYRMPQHRSIDIDSPLDWEWAEFLKGREHHG